MKRFGGRKVIVWIACMALFTLLLVNKHLTSDNYVQLVSALLLFYFASNVGAKFAGKPSGKPVGKQGE